MSNHQTIFSGIQPTGNLTIGNYIGAIKNWRTLQEDANCLFCLVDLHSLTVRNEPTSFADRCLDFIALYMACGIDPDQSVIFMQSHVPEHSELAWILSCHTPFGDLRRMTQFKEKAAKAPQNVNAGLLSYPVLMASDILLYKTDTVPVGDDQKQHLEMCRDIAQRFNGEYGEIFVVPRPMIPPRGARTKSLKDPTRKMSKTDDDSATYLALLDSPETVAAKVRKAVTSSHGGYPTDDDGSGIANLMTLYAEVTGKANGELADLYSGIGYAEFKRDLTEAVNDFLNPIQTTYREIRGDLLRLKAVLDRGAGQARAIASDTLAEVHSALGLLRSVHAVNR